MAKKPKKLRDMEITAIALVGKPANRRRFLMFKADRETVSKPYTGPSDKTLPDNVKELPKEKRDAWVKAFNNAWENYDKEKDKNYDPDRTLAQNKERYCFAVANAQIKEKTEKGGDEVKEKGERAEVIFPLEEFKKSLGRITEEGQKMIEALKADEEEDTDIEKKGAVLSKKNLKLVREMRELCTALLAAAGVEKEEVDPPQEEPEEKVEAAEQPVLTKEEAEKLKADADKLCTPDGFEAMLNARMDGGETE